MSPDTVGKVVQALHTHFNKSLWTVTAKQISIDSSVSYRRVLKIFHTMQNLKYISVYPRTFSHARWAVCKSFLTSSETETIQIIWSYMKVQTAKRRIMNASVK
jgi:hypothetical protein